MVLSKKELHLAFLVAAPMYVFSQRRKYVVILEKIAAEMSGLDQVSFHDNQQ